MRYVDLLWGAFEINEPLLLDLVASNTLQRLKGVDQAGYFRVRVPGAAVSRFDHSLGVLCLLRRFGASLLEQTAGLLHDASHSVFSHCIDYALDEGSETEQSHQDNFHQQYLEASDAWTVLSHHGIFPSSILDDSLFALKERQLPELCADRIDYSLRTAVAQGELQPAEVSDIAATLTVVDNRWVFSSVAAGRRFALIFQKMNDVYYAALPSALMFRTVGDALRYALRRQYISQSDLYTTDAVVLAKLAQAADSDEEMSLLWERMNNRISAVPVSEGYNARACCKSRMVDPLCLEHDRCQPLSAWEPSWRDVVRQGLQPKEYLVRFAR